MPKRTQTRLIIDDHSWKMPWRLSSSLDASSGRSRSLSLILFSHHCASSAAAENTWLKTKCLELPSRVTQSAVRRKWRGVLGTRGSTICSSFDVAVLSPDISQWSQPVHDGIHDHASLVHWDDIAESLGRLDIRHITQCIRHDARKCTTPEW